MPKGGGNLAKNTRVLGIVVGIMLLLAAGCGTVDVNVHVTYTDGGNLQDELTLKCTGAVANYILTPNLKDSLIKDGWEVTTDVTNEVSILTATKSRKQGSDSSSSSLGDWANDLVVTEGGNPFVKTYTTDFRIPPQNMALPEQSGSELRSQENKEQVIETMFWGSISITLPGKIVESNADKVQDNTATWHYTYKSLKSEHQLWVRSERILWGNIALAGGGGIFGLALFAYCAFRLGRSSKAGIPAVADPQAGGKPL